MTTAEILILVGLALIIALLVLVLLRLRGSGDGNGAHIERLERELRQELQASAQSTRQETAGHLAQYHNASVQQFDSMRQQMQLQSSSGREEQARALKRFADTLQQTLGNLTESNAQRMLEVRTTLESKIRDLQADNGKRLEEMRQTVDEKLHATLETRLTESFRQVSERLEKVHQGLGEMQQLAIGVGDLKRVLTNVKTRGTWGEVQLEMLLEQVLTVEQYAKNVETVAGIERAGRVCDQAAGHDRRRRAAVAADRRQVPEGAVRAPAGRSRHRADAEGVVRAGAELERAVRREAQTICDKYVSPPQTTDFAILFLPTEGLYAEVMRRPGLADDLQRTLRVTIAGPSTLTRACSTACKWASARWRWKSAHPKCGRCWAQSRPSSASSATCWPRPKQRWSGQPKTSKTPKSAAARWPANSNPSKRSQAKPPNYSWALTAWNAKTDSTPTISHRSQKQSGSE